MAESVTFQSATLATIPDGSKVAADIIATEIYQRVKVTFGVDGTATDVSSVNPLPVTGTLSANADAKATAAAPSYVEGTDNPLSQNLSGDLRVIAKQSTSPWVVSGTVAATQSGTWNVTVNTALPAGSNVIGHVIADTGSTTVVTGTVTTKEVRPATGTQTSVASSNTHVPILASNANRLGGTVTNDSTQILYLLLAAGNASNTNYTVQLAGSTTGGVAYYEIPFGYTGAIDGIWASANGNARVTELTA